MQCSTQFRFAAKVLGIALVISVLAFGGTVMFVRLRALQDDNAFLKDTLQTQQEHLAQARKLDVTLNLGTRYWFENPPMFIFRENFVPWTTFSSFLPAGVNATRIEPRVIGSFSSVFDAGTTAIPTEGTDGVSFPGPGEYGLYTNLGTFRVLILDPDASRDGELMDIASFVARNIVHSPADHASTMNSELRKALIGKLFLSDQPLFLWCQEGSAVLSDILKAMGYEARMITLQGPQFGGHSVIDAYFPDSGHWGMLDVDYGTFLKDARTGRILPMQEAASLLSTEPSLVETGFLAHKENVLSAYNRAPYTPHFPWRPDMLESAPKTTPEDYKGMMKDLGTDIRVFTKRTTPSN